MLGVSIGNLETMSSDFDETGAVYVSDVCLRSAGTNNASVNTWQKGASPTTAIGQVRRFLNLALPYTLPIHLCTSNGTSSKLCQQCSELFIVSRVRMISVPVCLPDKNNDLYEIK